jgi:hypothetical protein
MNVDNNNSGVRVGNSVLIGQFTTNGVFSYRLGIMLNFGERFDVNISDIAIFLSLFGQQFY